MRIVGRFAIAMTLICVANGCSNEIYRLAAERTGGDPVRGAQAIRWYGCDSCHMIPGIASANAFVGPPLIAMSRRSFVGGQLPNTPANMEQWIQQPQAINPHTAMPDVGVTDLDARDIAAYLYTLR
jgi:cytochrome c